MFKRLTPYRLFSAWAVRVMLLFALATVAACSSSDDGDDTAAGDTDTDQMVDGDMNPADELTLAFVSGNDMDFTVGQTERIIVDDVNMTDGAFPATLSDIRIATDGTDVYEIGRFFIESITRFSPVDLETPIFQFSTNTNTDPEANSPNTQEIVFASETKAYVLQANNPSILIVNPAATSEAEFITGSIDISAYDSVGAPEAVAGVIVNGRLFVLMQRLAGLSGFDAVNTGAIAVFDTATDEELVIGMNAEGLNGIVLNTTNAESIQYVEEFNELVVTSRGNFFEDPDVPGDPYQGGIETIDVDTFAVDVLLDDGTEESNNDFFNAALVTSAERGYVVTTSGFRINTLRSFSPMTGLLDDGVIAGLEDLEVTILANGPRGRVWVGVGGNEPGFILLDPADNSVVGERLATGLIPNDIVFIETSN